MMTLNEHGRQNKSIRSGFFTTSFVVLGLLCSQLLVAAEADSVYAAQDLADYAQKEASVRALLKAHDRISLEKGDEATQEQVQKRVASLLLLAKKRLDQGRPAEGCGILIDALNTLKVSIRNLRDGDTLVHSLNFESIEEEFDYELDRNDAYHMLVKTLLTEKISAQPVLAERVDKFIAQAIVLRQSAEKLAAKHGYEAAIEALEQSTKELLRAIRSAGFLVLS